MKKIKYEKILDGYELVFKTNNNSYIKFLRFSLPKRKKSEYECDCFVFKLTKKKHIEREISLYKSWPQSPETDWCIYILEKTLKSWTGK